LFLPLLFIGYAPSLFLERFNPTVRYDLMGHVLFDIVEENQLGVK
jgi:hypothetical protein